MDKLAAMTTFLQVVQCGSLSAASRALSMPVTSVSRNINFLEERLGTRLLTRTTRHLSLTEEGQVYFEHVKRILGDIEDAELILAKHSAEPTGRLVVSSPVLFGRVAISPLLPDFISRYPRVTVDLMLADRSANLIEDGSDIAIRVGSLEDSSFISRKLGSVRRVVCGSPNYLHGRGEPTDPLQLETHDCIQFTLLDTNPAWSFRTDKGEIAVPITGRIRTNNADVALAATTSGSGLMLAPYPLVQSHIQAGLLKVVLKEFEFPPTPIHAIFPHARLLSPRVRIFIDLLSEYCASSAFATLFRGE